VRADFLVIADVLPALCAITPIEFSEALAISRQVEQFSN